MEEQLLTAGQFAKLASTTKRTVTWYDKQGILSPYRVGSSGYRFYKPEQIIDFQIILLLRQHNFSIDQIKEFLSKNSSFKDLFDQKQKTIAQDINQLRRRLETIKDYYRSFEEEEEEEEGVLVKPIIKHIPKTEIYYVQKEGPYSKIYQYGLELESYFKNMPRNTEFLTVYEDPCYKPVKSRFKVGLIRKGKIKLKKEAEGKVYHAILPAYKSLSYTFKGTPSLLSFHWKQLEIYAALHGLKHDASLPFTDIELYKRSGFIKPLNEDQVITEMLFPIQ